MLFRPAGDLVLVHVVDMNFMLGTGQPLNRVNRILAGCAARAKDLDFVLH